MTTLYTFDRAGYYTGQQTLTNPHAPQPAGTTVAPPTATEGHTPVWTGHAWALVPSPQPGAAQPAVPQVVSMRQARLALLVTGRLQQVTDAFDLMQDEGLKAAAKIEWEYATEVRRDWPLVEVLRPALSMSHADVDDLFIAAAAL
jgi:hypothetical protein